jgi:hypothetical protein
VISRLSSTLPVIRWRGVKLWACNAEAHRSAAEPINAPAKMLEGNAFIKRIVVILDPSFGEKPPMQQKVALPIENILKRRWLVIQSRL